LRLQNLKLLDIKLKQATEIYKSIPVYLKFISGARQLATADTAVLKALSIASKIGWRGALEEVYGKDSEAVKYATDARRQSFLDLVPLTSTSAALEIGVGFGQHTIHLARRVGHLSTYELNLTNALFTKIRCEQEDVTNASHYCGGDDCTLPFGSDSFDVVILNLVLEWCAGGNTDAPAVLGHARLLKEIQRVLKPGGCMQLNTKNRFALRYVLGGRDEHLGLIRFGSALPRFVSRSLMAITRTKAQGHLHSYQALRRLVKRCGFEIVSTYEAYPEMRFPDVFVDSASPHQLPRSQMLGPTRRTNLVMRLIPLKARKYFSPGLFILARK
jgi:SAM-dependent methyltransferase